MPALKDIHYRIIRRNSLRRQLLYDEYLLKRTINIYTIADQRSMDSKEVDLIDRS